MEMLMILLQWFSAIIVGKLLFNQKELLKTCLNGSMLFLGEYSFLSAVFLWLNMFNVKVIVGLSIVINLIIAAIFHKSFVNFKHMEFGKKGEIIILVLVLFLIPFVSKKSEVIETGCDAGMYMEKAISLVYSDSDNVQTLSEYNTISKQVSEETLNLQAIQLGLYKYYLDDEIYQYEYHAIHIWSAVLALFIWGTGIYKGASVLTFLYVLSGLFMYYIAERICINKIGKYMAFFLLCFSPLILYLAKITLSEMWLLTVFLAAMYCLVQEDVRLQAISPVCMGLLGFSHLSALLYVPLFYFIFFVLFFDKKEIKYGYYNIVQLVLYAVSFLFCYATSKVYTESQLVSQLISRLGKWFRVRDVIPLIMTCVTLGILFQIFFMWKMKQESFVFNRCIAFLIDKKYVIIIRIVFIALGLLILYKGYLLGFTDRFLTGEGNWALRNRYAYQGFRSLSHLDIVSIVMSTSYLCVPIIIEKVFSKKTKFQLYSKIVLISVIYVAAYYTISSCDRPSLYYSARYFAIVMVPMMILLTCSLLEQSRSLIIVGVVCFITALPFNYLHLSESGFAGSFEVVQDLTSVIDKDSIVLINPEGQENRQLNLLAVNNLRIINSCKVYNALSCDEVMEKYNDRDDIYIVSSSNIQDDRFECILSKQYVLNMDLVSYNGFFPLKEKENSFALIIYKIRLREINITMDEIKGSRLEGFYGLEKTSYDDFYSWTNGDSYFCLNSLQKKDYDAEIQYLSIPQGALEDLEQLVISVDNHIVMTSSLKAEGDVIHFSIPEEYIGENGECNIHIRSGTWVPQDCLEGSQDSRALGIPVTNFYVKIKSE